jgi:ankyrin repeat protein
MHKKEVRSLLRQGADPNLTDWNGENSIIHAIKKNFNDILGVIIDSTSVPINLNNRFYTKKITYLMMAARLCSSDTIKTLLTAKADPNITDEDHRTAIFYSIFKNDEESIYDLAEGGTILTINDDVIPLPTPNHQTPPCHQLFVKIKKNKKTCVDYAYQKNKIELISYLFSKGGALADNTQRNYSLFS